MTMSSRWIRSSSSTSPSCSMMVVRRGTDQADHLVDISDRDGEADQDMSAIAGLAEQMLGAPGDDLLAEGDKGPQQVLEVHHLRTAAVERHHVGAEGRLQRGESVEL